MSVRSTRYDNMLVFFGNRLDLRGRLILDSMMDYWRSSAPGVSLPMDNRGDVNKDTILGQCNQEEVKAFSYDVQQRIKTMDSTIQAAGLSTIKNLDIQNPNNLNVFFVHFIQAFTKVKMENSDVTNVPSKWYKADKWEWKPQKLGAALGTAKQNTKFSGNVEFNCNFDFILQRLYEKLGNDAKIVIARSNIMVDSQADDPDVVRDYNNVLRNKEGEDVGRGSKNYFQMKQSERCFTTGMPEAQCSNYMKKCLIGQDLGECSAFMKSDNYWNDMVNDVNRMNPVMAQDTLSAFQFDIVEKNGVKLPESVASWNKNLVKKLQKTKSQDPFDDARVIINNQRLQAYLLAVYAKVVRNPALLNQNLEHMIINEEADTMGIKLKKMHGGNQLKNLINISNVIKTNNDNYAIDANINQIKNYLTKQNGGDDSNNLVLYNQWLSNDFAKLHKDINKRLRNNKQKIFEEDNIKLKKNINELNDAEQKFYKTKIFKNKYATLLDLYGENDKLNKETLDKWNETHKKYFMKVDKRQQNLIDAFINLEKQLKNK